MFFLILLTFITDEASGLFSNPEADKSAYLGTNVVYQIYFYNDDELVRWDIELFVRDDQLLCKLDIDGFSIYPTQHQWVNLTIEIPRKFSLGEHETVLYVETQSFPIGDSEDRSHIITTTILAPEVVESPGLPYGAIFTVGIVGIFVWSYFRPWWSPFRYIPMVWIWGYARFEKDAILDNPIRLVVYNKVLESPGISEANLIAETGFSRGAIRYALDRLEEFEKIKRGNQRQYYDLGPERPGDPIERLPQLEQEIIYEIRENHLESQRELAARLGMKRSTISVRLRKMVQRGYLRPHYSGRVVTYEFRE